MELIFTEHSHYDVIKIMGRIDRNSSPISKRAMISSIQNGHSGFRISMKEDSFKSSSGILFLVNRQKLLANQKKDKIAFLRISDMLLSSFQITGFYQRFTFDESKAAALRYF